MLLICMQSALCILCYAGAEYARCLCFQSSLPRLPGLTVWLAGRARCSVIMNVSLCRCAAPLHQRLWQCSSPAAWHPSCAFNCAAPRANKHMRVKFTCSREHFACMYVHAFLEQHERNAGACAVTTTSTTTPLAAPMGSVCLCARIVVH